MPDGKNGRAHRRAAAPGHRRPGHLHARRADERRPQPTPKTAPTSTCRCPTSFPVVVLVRGDDGLWRYSRDTVNAVPTLYKREPSAPSRCGSRASCRPCSTRRALGLYLWQYLYAGLLLLVAWLMGQFVRLLLRGQVRRMVERIWVFELERRGVRQDQHAHRPDEHVRGGGLRADRSCSCPSRCRVRCTSILNVLLWLVRSARGQSRFVNLGAFVAKDWATRRPSPSSTTS